MYHLTFWGEGQEQAATLLSSSQREYWFKSDEERSQFRNFLKEKLGESLMFHEADGIAALVRGVATVALNYMGQTYTVISKLHYGDDCGVLDYMWREGVLADHQNRADLIREQCDPHFPELPEGHTITLVNMHTDYEPAQFNVPHNARTDPPQDGEQVLGYHTIDGFHEVHYLNGEYWHFDACQIAIHYWYHKPPSLHLQLPKEFRPAYSH